MCFGLRAPQLRIRPRPCPISVVRAKKKKKIIYIFKFKKFNFKNIIKKNNFAKTKKVEIKLKNK